MENRYHAMDALRASALLLGIVLHGTMSFLPAFRAVGWPIVDDSPSTALSAVYFAIHIFRVALFFVIAGFFARLLVARLGPWGFCKHRLKRIGLPLLGAMVLVMPLAIVPLIVAVKMHPGAGKGAYLALRPQGGIAWGHLWFLYLLLLLDAAGMAGRAVVLAVDRTGALRRNIDRVMHVLATTRLLPLAFATPLCLALYVTPWWQAWDGIPAPIVGFIPNYLAVLGFGSALLLGWLLHRQQALLAMLARDWPGYLTAAIASSAVALALVGPQAGFRVVPLAPAVRLGYAASYTLAMWSWCLALVGLATRFRHREDPRWRYLADASYWMYLAHIPVIWGLQVTMMHWRLPWTVKYPLILAITVGVLLLGYRYLVRGTWVGKLLNGRRLPSGVGRGGGQLPIAPTR
jgi:glucan biosynthesis protein C